MAKRLDIDTHVVAYYGFDEANETDPAIDEGSYSRNLIVDTSPAVVPARVNNGRQFDGATTFAHLADSSPYRLAGDMTLIVWVTLTQMNTSGSLQRCIIECGGASAASADDNRQYALYVTNLGELVYAHDHGTGLEVLFKTAPQTIRAGRFYCLVIRRATNVVQLYIDNRLIPWASCTDNGVTHDPLTAVTAPSGGAAAAFKVGKSDRLSDNGFWFGTVDELSLHDLARSYAPYLRAVYFRLTLYTLYFRLSAYNTVKSVGSAEMGGGSRWWVYERDGSLYAVRENTLGLFSAEVQLTTGGLQPNGVIAPGGTTMPELIYDKASDTLLVAFIAAGRVFKLTAGVGDPPPTRQMPYTVDTASIVKVRDSNEAIRTGAGRGFLNVDQAKYTLRTPIKVPVRESFPFGSGQGTSKGTFFKSPLLNGGTWEVNPPAPVGLISFTDLPSFGILIPNENQYGYAVYSKIAGVEKFLGKVTVRDTTRDRSNVYFWAITSRVYGMSYYVKPIDFRGRIGFNLSNVIQDLFGRADVYNYVYPNALVINRDGDHIEDVGLGAGQGSATGASMISAPLAYTNRTPLKLARQDSGTIGGGGGLAFSLNCTPNPTAPQRQRYYQ